MKWDNVLKEKISYAFAGLALAVGFGITIAGFCVEPVGEIHSTVLLVLGQCLVWSGAILGFNLSVKNGVATIKGEINRKIERKFTELEQKAIAESRNPDSRDGEGG